jgi:tRNA A37 threonylcarbamoyladenosine synthetase subunit TsaC/SUA5/YrdC
MNPNKLYLTQTDTTVGFLSADSYKLSIAKDRDANQPYLICVDTLKKLKKLTRVPKPHKKRIRRTLKTSFLYPNKKAIRVVKESPHSRFLKEFDFLYSSSANKNRESFDLNYAYLQAEIIIEDARGFYEADASSIFKLGKKKILKLR